jgi:hypothetical protein
VPKFEQARLGRGEHLAAVSRLSKGQGPPHELVAEYGVSRLRAGEQGRGGALVAPRRHGGAGPPRGGGRGALARRNDGAREGQGQRDPATRRHPQLGGRLLGAARKRVHGGGLRGDKAVVREAFDRACDRRRHGSRAASWNPGAEGRIGAGRAAR